MSFEDDWKDIELFYDRFKRLKNDTIKSILDRWSERRPLELKLDLMQEILTNFGRLKETMESIIRYLRERNWRGAIISIVGEYGSGKTQFGQILLRKLEEDIKFRENIFSKIITISPTEDIRELILKNLNYERPTILIVDEIDQLLGELERGNRRRIEDLADLIRGITEESYGNPAKGSIIMLLSKRASEAMKRDKALGGRLMDRSKEFSLSISEGERERASKEALKRIIALWMAYYNMSPYTIRDSFERIYPFMRRIASELSRTREIGGIVKSLTELLSEIIENLGRFKGMGKIEEGRFAEDLLKRFLVSEARSIQLKVRMGDITKDYIAIFSNEPLSVSGARTDAHFNVWTYDPEIGIKGDVQVARVGIEIKYGEYWKERRDQLLKITEKHPLLLISITEIDPDEITEIKIKMDKGNFDIININPDLFRVLHVLRDEAAMWFLRKYSTLKRDLEEALEGLIRGYVKVKEEISEQDILSEASTNVLSSVLRELKRAKNSKRYETLSKVIVGSIEMIFNKYGMKFPSFSDTMISEIVKALEREGIGKLSQSGKSFYIDSDSRSIINDIEQDLERRKRVEKIIFNIISRPIEVMRR
jgi:hypothetical protein